VFSPFEGDRFLFLNEEVFCYNNLVSGPFDNRQGVVEVPFKAIPETDFVNREEELNSLRRLTGLKDGVPACNVLLEGARGMGKTELLKQFYRAMFWEGTAAVPFYFSLQRATLKAAHFSRDYFTRFIRQYLAYSKKDPSLIVNMGIPMAKLLHMASSLGLHWMIELIEDFQEQSAGGEVYEQLLGAISAPAVTASRSGKPVLVMLDDFHLATQLYEAKPGDSPGLLSLFDGYMKTSLSPHILTGSPEGALNMIFTDDSLRGKVERISVRPLPEDAAFSFFRSQCAKFGVSVLEECLGLMKVLGGNPLYIRNMARAAWKMRRKEVGRRDFWECYSYEVSEGETAFYWSSIFGGFLRDVEQRRVAIELLMYSMDSHCEAKNLGRISRILRTPEQQIKAALDGLQMSGVIHTVGSIQPISDNILQDFIRSLYMKEVEGRAPERVREVLEKRYYPGSSAPASCFEMTIPMTADAELVAARAVEQIGKNISLKPEVITQLQLALIEACLNAMEHSGSYEKKVLLKFTVSPERIEIIIESPGRVFAPEPREAPSIEERLQSGQRRGWGLKLMREIMDEVRVETIEDRTRVILVKNIIQG
jgi:serine/threonine-protein kinase RsbW